MNQSKRIIYVTRNGRSLTGAEIEMLVAQAEVAEYEVADRFLAGRIEPSADARAFAQAVNDNYQALVLAGMESDVAVKIISNMIANMLGDGVVIDE